MEMPASSKRRLIVFCISKKTSQYTALGTKQRAIRLIDEAASSFTGHVILEVTTSKARTAAEREALLVESLAFARQHLLR